MVALLGAVTAFAGNIETLNQDNFGSETSKGTVLVDFYAEWCGPCKRMGPVLDMVADDMKGQVAIYKVNIDKSPDLAKEYEVKGVPTLVLMKDGEVKGKLVGFRDKSAVTNFIQTGN